MPATIVKLLPEVDQLVRLADETTSLAELQTAACEVASNAGTRWQQLHRQLRRVQLSREVNTAQKLQLAPPIAGLHKHTKHQKRYERIHAFLQREIG